MARLTRLTAAQRRALPSSAFADPKHRAYPINDAGHAKAAESMVAAHGSSEQKREVHTKVKKRYGFGGGPVGE